MMAETEKITIIEGPPPTFEISNDPLLLGLTESPTPMQVAMCHLRAHNGATLVERCYRAWSKGQTIRLEFRSEEGLTIQAPIVASRWTKVPEGNVLMLWIQLEDEGIEIDYDFNPDPFDEDFGGEFDEFDNDFDDEFDDSDLDLLI
jgi:hypothetical protein